MSDLESAAGVPEASTPFSYLVSLAALLMFFPAGLMSLWHSIRSRRLFRAGQMHASRVASERARIWCIRACISLITCGVLALLALIALGNDHAVLRGFLNLSSIRATMPEMLRGFLLNIELFTVGEVAVLAWSLIVAVCRSLPGTTAAPIRWMMMIYVDVFRGLPSLLVILIVAYGVARTGLPILSSLSDFQSVLLALTLVYGAYVGEVIKGGIDAVHWSQTAAARSLGLSYFQTTRYVVLPQAIRTIIPPLLNAFISLQKDTSLVGIIGLLDAVNVAQIQAVQYADLSVFTGVGLCFLVITIPLTRVADAMMKRDRRRVQAG